MSVSRREFLAGALALTVATQVAPEALSAPTLYGDGKHDDTQALQALLDGKPVWVEGQWIDGAYDIDLSGGEFKISDTLIIRRDNISLRGAKIVVADSSFLKTIIHAEDVQNVILQDLHLTSNVPYGDFAADRWPRAFELH